VIEIAKTFASHVSLPKKGFIEYVEPVKAISVVPKIVKQVAGVSHKEPKPYVEKPPFPARIKENLLRSIVNKSSQRDCTPYEQVEVFHQVSALKELNEQEPSEVYFVKTQLELLKVKAQGVGNHLYLLLLVLLVIMVFVIWDQA
jgi:hypothetical protein